MTQGLKISTRIIFYAVIVILLLLAVALTEASIQNFIEYSSFSVGLTKALIGVFLVSAIDDLLFWKIDTIKELKKGNLAYALVYLSVSIIVAACIGFA